MRFFKNGPFQRDLKDNKIDDESIKIVLGDIFEGRAISLGSKLYKIRGAVEGTGKSGGFRSLFFWKKDKFIVFCLLFTKNEQDNLSPDEGKALKMLSKEYDNLTENDIKQRIENRSFTEVKYEK